MQRCAAIDAAEAEGEIGCEAILAAVAEDKDERRLAAERWAWGRSRRGLRHPSRRQRAAAAEMELMDHIAEVVNGELVAEDIQKPGASRSTSGPGGSSPTTASAAAAEGAKLLLSGGLMGALCPI